MFCKNGDFLSFSASSCANLAAILAFILLRSRRDGALIVHHEACKEPGLLRAEMQQVAAT